MEPRRETRWEHFRDSLRLVAMPGWKPVLLLLLLGGASYLLIHQQVWNMQRPTVTKEGRIIRFGLHNSRSFSPLVAVIVRSSDGTMFEIHPSPQQIAPCRAGDRIAFTTGPDGTRIDRCGP